MRKYVAQKDDDSVQFEAENHNDAIRLLAEGGYTNYKIIWEGLENSGYGGIVGIQPLSRSCQ